MLAYDHPAIAIPVVWKLDGNRKARPLKVLI
jgi:hypothetical protein